MKKVLIVGANGLIGRHLIERLRTEYRVLALGRKDPRIKNVSWVEQDLEYEIDFQKFPQEVDKVVYLAQSEHFREFPDKASSIFRVNTLRMLEIIDYARRKNVQNFIYASSGGVYGTGERGFSEDSTVPAKGYLGFYLSTKLCSEILAENYTEYMKIAVLRFFFVYGSGQKRSMLIPRLVDNVRAGNPITLEGEEGILINPTHVSDAVEAISASLCLENSEVFNIGGPDILSLKDICMTIGGRVGVEPVFKMLKNTKPKNLIGDISKMKKQLWEPVINFKKGLESVL